MDEKKIEVTKNDLMKALAHVVTNDKNTFELVISIPSLIMVFPIIIDKVWNQLTGETNKKEEEENGSRAER